MLSLYLILPFLVAQSALAAPLQSTALVSALDKDTSYAEIEPRQRRPGGGGGRQGRPSRTRAQQAATQAAASSAAPAPVNTPATIPAPAASSPVAAPPAEPVASGNSDSGSGSNTPPAGESAVAPAPSASGGDTGAGASETTPAQGSGVASAPASSGTGGTSSGSSGNVGGGGGGPVGTGWDPNKNKASLDTYVQAGLQWFTNWSPSAATYPAAEFVPMIHSPGSVDLLKDAMGTWPSGTKYVLSLNEPDQGGDVGGSSTTPADAVTAHNKAAEMLGDGYSLGTPAVARGGGTWLDQWLTACEGAGGCKYDFVPYHYYGKDANALIQYTKEFHAKYNKPLWLTEWACYEFTPKSSCTAAETEEFMKTAIEWFRGEGSSMVVRWAWFGAFPDMKDWGGNNMDSNRIAKVDGTINDLGIEYLKL